MGENGRGIGWGNNMSEAILEIKNLTKYYGKVKGVENLSLSLNCWPASVP